MPQRLMKARTIGKKLGGAFGPDIEQLARILLRIEREGAEDFEKYFAHRNGPKRNTLKKSAQRRSIAVGETGTSKRRPMGGAPKVAQSRMNKERGFKPANGAAAQD